MSKQKKTTTGAKGVKKKGAKPTTTALAATGATSAASSTAPAKHRAKAAKSATPKPTKQRKKRSGGALDGAAKVLAGAKKPMQCKEMVEKMLAGKLWSTSGKTPAATLYSAIIREIRDKGKQARFRKTGRGHFALNTTVASPSAKRGAA